MQIALLRGPVSSFIRRVGRARSLILFGECDCVCEASPRSPPRPWPRIRSYFNNKCERAELREVTIQYAVHYAAPLVGRPKRHVYRICFFIASFLIEIQLRESASPRLAARIDPHLAIEIMRDRCVER